MKILVTGGTGFLGKHLTPKLLAAGHEVRLIGRSQPPPELARAEYFPGELSDRAAVSAALSGVDVVYHLAGRVSFDPRDGRAMYALHVDATRELLKDAHLAKVKRFILASTSGTTAVSKEERTATEEDVAPIPVIGRWPYYLSKLYEEQLTVEFCRAKKLPLVVLNPSLLLGPGDERLSSTWTVMKFLRQELPAVPGGGFSFVDVRDAADAFVQALTRGDLYGKHLLGLNMPFTEFFSRLENLSGVPSPKFRLPSQLNILGAGLLEKLAKWRGLEPGLDVHSAEIAEHFFYLNADKAQRELGFSARDPYETLKDTVHDLLRRIPVGFQPGTKGRLAQSRR